MKLTLLLLAPALLLPTALLTSAPPTCAVQVRQIGSHSFFRQIGINVSIVSPCPVEGRAVIRYRTAGGGVLPPIGYIVLRGSFPRNTGFWLRQVASVEQKFNGKWKTIWRSEDE